MAAGGGINCWQQTI